MKTLKELNKYFDYLLELGVYDPVDITPDQIKVVGKIFKKDIANKLYGMGLPPYSVSYEEAIRDLSDLTGIPFEKVVEDHYDGVE